MKRPITESVASLRGVAPRVYLQIQQDGDQEPLAKALMATLQEEKFPLPGIERLPISKMPAKPQVRYFSNDDREAALRVVEAARKAIPSLSFEAVRVTKLPAPAGTLEVWFSRQG